jgi:hypothetical protein
MLNEKLIGRIQLIKKLQPSEKIELYALMARYYDDVKQNIFFEHLSDKHHIILFFDKK